MPLHMAGWLSRTRAALRAQLLGPRLLALLPAVTLAAYWLGGQAALVVLAIILPGLFALSGLFGPPPTRPARDTDGLTGLALRRTVTAALDHALANGRASGRACGAMAFAIDRFDDATRDLDDGGSNRVIAAVADRICATLRETDVVARAAETQFAAALPDLRRATYDTMVEVGSRIQEAVGDPISVSGQRVFVTVSIGFCLPGNLAAPDGEALLRAAEAALDEARRAGGATVRGYRNRVASPIRCIDTAQDGLRQALDEGQIRPWFQPQISTGTSTICGVEALARWEQPGHGIIPPEDFLPKIIESGLAKRLNEVTVYAALQSLRDWDQAGLEIPGVSVNFDHEELAMPELTDRVRWDLDRFDIAPERLAVEVMETALASDADAVERNLRSLAALGCRIDLDDFGTGNTSIASLKRFSIDRLKIDRSFITRVDRDKAQRDLVQAILAMAKGLGLETIAEGVETPSEHAALAELGCDMVQGFTIARPMPASDMAAWVAGYRRVVAAMTVPRDITAPSQHGLTGKTA